MVSRLVRIGQLRTGDDVEDLVARLGRSDTAAVADAQGGFGILDPAIRTVVPGRKVAGRAFTVKCYPGSIITVHKALIEAQPGDVLVVDGEADGRGEIGRAHV